MSISDDEVEAARKVIGPRISRKNMRAALTAAAKVRANSEGDGEWVRNRDNTFDLGRSADYPGDNHGRARRAFYNVIDWTGQHRGQIALTVEEFGAINPIRPLASIPATGGEKV